MPASIVPLPVLSEPDDEARQRRAASESPKSLVVRYGYLKMIAELSFDGDTRPGCGAKLVIRSRRGIELGEAVTTVCSNTGCGKPLPTGRVC